MRVRLKRERLIEFLSQGRLSQNHWAIKLGLSRGHLSDLVNGKHPYPSPITRQKLIEGLGLSFDELFSVETGTTEWTHSSSASFQAALADRYVIDEEVGQGGMGTVYLARDVKHGRRVAIKVVSPEIVSGVGTDQFLREIRKAAQLEHPHILTLLDSGEAAGYPYYVMPFVRGGSLRRLLEKRRTLALGEATQIVRGIAAALRYAHEQRVLHCDIKPENILLGEDGHAYLADFGVARAIHAEVRQWRRPGEIDTSAGTPAYVSPEQASGDPDLQPRSDVYSLGCVLYEMLAGVRPFGGTTTMEIVAKRFTETPELRTVARRVPADAAGVVRRAMSSNPHTRYATAMAMMQDLERAAARPPRISAVIAGSAWAALKAGAAFPLTFLKGVPFMTHVVQDVIYTIRSLKRRPVQTTVLLATLALGIGVNSAMFSVVSTVLLRPLPYPEPDRLVQLWESSTESPRTIRIAYPNFLDMRGASDQLAGLAGYMAWSMPVSGGTTPVRVRGAYVTENFFDVMGRVPRVGAVIPADAPAGMGHVVLGDGLWRTTFGADPDILGRVIHVLGRPATVVGVMPPGFAHPAGTEFWMVQSLDMFFGPEPSRTAHNLWAVGRMKPGVEVSVVRAEMTGVAQRLARVHPDQIDERFDIAVVPLHEELAGESRGTLVLLLSVVGIVLLIACGNIASILSGQALARHKEMAIRRSVGADAGRLVRQVLTESVVVGLVGSLAGLALSVASMSALNAIVPADFLHSGRIGLDWRVVTFTVGLGFVTGAIFGVLPAWRAAMYHPADAMRAGGSEVVAGAKRWRAGGFFVVPQYAFSLTAVIVAGLILKSLLALSNVDPGFPTSGRLTVDLDLPTSPPSPYGDREKAAQFFRELVARAAALPGVQSVTLALSPPLSSPSELDGGVQREDEDPAAPRWDGQSDWRVVGAKYFRTVGIPVLRGRDFDEGDDGSGDPVVVVNQALARQLWGDADPLGKRLRLSSLDNNAEEARRALTVVGIVPDVHHRSLSREPRSAVYAPFMQHLDRIYGADLIMAAGGSLRDYSGPVRDLIRSIDPDLPIGRIETLDGWKRASMADSRFRAALLGAFGALAVLLAVLGVYGVMSYSVTQRRREVAVRVALGARGQDVVRMLTGEGLRFVVIGQVAGLAAAFALTRLVRGFLFGVGTTDATVFAGASAALATVVLLTSYLPARRAAAVRPVEVLRE